MTQNQQEIQINPLVMAVIFEGGLGVIAVVVGWFLSMRILQNISWDPVMLLYGVAVTFPLSLFFLLAIRSKISGFVRIRKLLQLHFIPIFSTLSVIDMALMAILSGIGEELLFRGLLQGIATEYLGFVASIILTNILFGMAHLVTPLYSISTFVIGSLLGLSYHYTGNLLLPITVHSLYNFISFVYLLKFSKIEAVDESNNSDPT